MLKAAERLKQITPKIERAKEHAAEAQREIEAFLKTEPYKVGAKRDPSTQRTVYYLTGVADTPDHISLVTGDCVQNLISALDHLAYQLVCGDTGDAPPKPHNIYFPIAENLPTYSAKKSGKMAGASPATMIAIDGIKPYKSDNFPLWALQQLNNIEKHRLLITVGSLYSSLNVGPLMLEHLQRSFNADPKSPFYGKEMPGLDLFLKPKDALFPLKTGHELFIDLPNAEIRKVQFQFAVGLYEPNIIEARELLPLLQEFVSVVSGIVQLLEPHLK